MTSKHISTKYKRTFAAIDLTAIENNLNALKSFIKPGVKSMAVVKANAYGHGSVRVASHIENKVDYFAVASIEEGMELREAGITKPILVLSYTAPVQYEMLIENNITATLYNCDEAKILSDKAVKLGKKAKVHLAVDTGMGRIGFSPDEEGADSVKEISLLEGIYLEGLFSHYACADCYDKKDALCQTKLFDEFIKILDEKNVEIPIKHICNSAGTIDFEKQYNMCRLGISLYGLYPSEEIDKTKIKLTPAMEVVSHVVHIKNVSEGFKIGYGHTYEAPGERKIATVSIGYADGYNRCFSNCGYVLINGFKAFVTGRVCMDQIMVDVTGLENISVGDHAVILGKSEGEEITAEELGNLSYSFNYEVVCNYMPRVARLYYINGEMADF